MIDYLYLVNSSISSSGGGIVDNPLFAKRKSLQNKEILEKIYRWTTLLFSVDKLVDELWNCGKVRKKIGIKIKNR